MARAFGADIGYHSVKLYLPEEDTPYISEPAVLALKDYRRQRAEGKNPEFRAADIGLAGKTEFWN